MKIGVYSLDDHVGSYPELSEISPLEYTLLPKAYDGEHTYKGFDVTIGGQSWETFLSALADGKIYKIAAQFVSDDDEVAKRLYSEVFAFYVHQFGEPNQTTPTAAHRWNQPFGSLILGRVAGPEIQVLNLIGTSNSRPVSRLEHQKRGHPNTKTKLNTHLITEIGGTSVRTLSHYLLFRKPRSTVFSAARPFDGKKIVTILWKTSEAGDLEKLHHLLVGSVVKHGFNPLKQATALLSSRDPAERNAGSTLLLTLLPPEVVSAVNFVT